MGFNSAFKGLIRPDVFYIKTKYNRFSSNTSITFMKYSLGYMFRPSEYFIKVIDVLDEKRLYFVLIWNTSGRMKLRIYIGFSVTVKLHTYMRELSSSNLGNGYKLQYIFVKHKTRFSKPDYSCIFRLFLSHL
jgi:hypothetical protein